MKHRFPIAFLWMASALTATAASSNIQQAVVATAVLSMIVALFSPLLGAVIASFWAQRIIRAKHPEAPAYRWGYFIGFYTIYAGILILLFSVSMGAVTLCHMRGWSSVGALAMEFLGVVVGLAAGWSGLHAVDRERWAFITSSILFGIFNALLLFTGILAALSIPYRAGKPWERQPLWSTLPPGKCWQLILLGPAIAVGSLAIPKILAILIR